MADTKISDETSAGTLDGAEIIPVVRGSGSPIIYVNRRTTAQDIANLALGMKLISTQIASGSAQLDFTGLTGGTKTYKAIGRVLIPATNDATLHVRIGTGGTPTYDTGANYRNSGWALGSNGFNASFSGEAQTSIKLHIGESSTGVGAAFEITFAGPTVIGTFSSGASDTHDYGGALHGRWGGGTTFTALRFFQSSGNITSGSISLYELAA